MATCSPQTLLSTNPCYATLSPHLKLAIEIQMLCNLKNKLESAGDITCDVQELLTQGKCFVEMADAYLEAIRLQLICDISNLLA